MTGKGSTIRSALGVLVLAQAALIMSGCHYATNRLYDFCDVFQVGVGATFENPESGILPPAFGIHAQASEYLNLGAHHFAGYTAEWDGRGFFAGYEKRSRWGLGPFQMIQVDQDYDLGRYNYFKVEDALWTQRMNSREMRWNDAPAKELEYSYWAEPKHVGSPIFHRGWQYWENFSLEVGLSEPFLTHWGLNLRLGLDPSEVSDFLLGFFTLDFKQDDLNQEELDEMIGRRPDAQYEHKPPSD